MPITDYNKKKQLEVTTQNDSGTTQDKAQPVLLRGELETAFNLDSASLSQSKNVSANINDAEGIAFNDDGTKMFIADDDTSPPGISEYNLTTAYDISTATFSQFFDTSAQDAPFDVDFNDDGTKMFINYTTFVFSYNLSTGYDISTASFNQSFQITENTDQAFDLGFNNDGTKMFLNSAGTQEIVEYSLSTGYDISTASFNQAFDISTNTSDPDGLAFNNDGTKMFITDEANAEVLQYNLSTSFDVSTSSFNQSLNVGNEDSTPEDLDFNQDGSKMYVSGESTQTIYEYNLEQSDQTTGTGDIVIDFTNIADAQDIAVYDQNGNLLDYEIEDLDTTAETAVLWCYNSWTRDDTVQAQIAYGDNSANIDRQNVTGTYPTSEYRLNYTFKEESAPLLDSTSNNIDEDTGNTVGITRTAEGQFSNAYSLDGTDDQYISVNNDSVLGFTGTTPFATSAWIKLDSLPSSGNRYELTSVQESGNVTARDKRIDIRDDGTVAAQVFDGSEVTADSNTTLNTGEWHLVGVGFDGSNLRVVVDGVEENSTATSSTFDVPNAEFGIGVVNGRAERDFVDGTVDQISFYQSYSENVFQAEYDASPKAGQVYFSQQAAEDTVQITEDTATKANGVSTSQTSTEVVSITDTATKANSDSTSLQADSTSSATDTVTVANAVSTSLTTTETADYLDIATKANGVSTSQISTELEVEVDTVTLATGVSTALTSNEALPVTDNAQKATAITTSLTSVEVVNEVDTVVKAAGVTTTRQAVETSSATDTATKADAVTISQTSEEVIFIIETATKANGVSTSLTTTEQIVQTAPNVTPPLKVIEEQMLKFIKEE